MKYLKVLVLLGIMMCMMTSVSFAYLKIEGIPVTENGGSEFVEALSVDSDFVTSGNDQDIQGGELKIFKYIDKSTPKLIKFVAKEKTLPKLDVTVEYDDGTQDRYVFNVVQLKSVNVIKEKGIRNIEESVYKYKNATRAEQVKGKRRSLDVSLELEEKVKLDDNPVELISDGLGAEEVFQVNAFGRTQPVDFVKKGKSGYIKIDGIIGQTQHWAYEGYSDVDRWSVLSYEDGTGYLTIVKAPDRSTKRLKRYYERKKNIANVLLEISNCKFKFTGLELQGHFGDFKNKLKNEEYTFIFRKMEINGNIQSDDIVSVQ